MSQDDVPSGENKNVRNEIESLRTQGFDTLYSCVVLVTRLSGYASSESSFKSIFLELLGIEGKISNKELEELVPAEHPLRTHFRVVSGTLLIDKYVLLLILERRTKDAEGHKQSTVKAKLRKLAIFAATLRKELGLPDVDTM